MLAKNPKARAIVYSHYLESGVNPYKKKLEELGIPHGTFTGDMSRAKRDQMVRDYNAGKLNALLLSSAGGEGLDLKGTRLVQILEPHWNRAKIDQVIGRGIRYKSHAALPENERNVRVQRFMATRAPYGAAERVGWRKPGYGVDEYLDEMGARKERLNNQVRDLLREHENT
jgi:superfamily II DNA helicase RecQ